MKATRLLAASALLALCHCEIPHAQLDGSVTDGSAMDASEASSDAALVPHPACDSVTDLMDADPIDAGTGVRVMGDNGDAPEGVSAALQPSGGRCEFRAIKQKLYRYRLRQNAALRVSTNNPGSDSAFDSAIFITTAPCARNATVLACNDDDPFAPPNPHVTLSQATTGGLRAGTEVIISVSGFYPAEGSGQPPNPLGEAGAYELTVTEVPSREAGASCDTTGRADACVDGAHCIADDSGAGTCVLDGSRPGAQCDAGGECQSPLECNTTRFTCFRTSTTAGDVCELGESANRCGAGFSCVTALRGQRRGACAPNGTEGAACAVEGDAGASACAAGLVCARGVCKRPVAMGAACNLLSDACASGASCVASAAAGGVGTCVADGTIHGSACRSGNSECDPGLFCIIDNNRERACRTVGTSNGARCDNLGVCSYDWPCVVEDPSRPLEGVCRTPGETGTECRTDTGCAGGRRCVGASSTVNGRCLPVVARDAACDPYRRVNICDTGSSCAVVEGSARCVADGTAPLSNCRSGNQCDAGLACAAELGGRCVVVGMAGSACVPRFNSVRCTGGTSCVARSFSEGTCESPTMESEPNDALTGGTPANSLAVRGALGRFDLDCFALTVPDGASVFAQAVNPAGLCTSNLVLDLYGPSGAWLGGDADAGPAGCPRVDGGVYSWARALAGGTYRVCVREANNQIASGYVLSARSF